MPSPALARRVHAGAVMDQLPALPANYRVEHHEEGLSPLLLGLYTWEPAARRAFAVAFTEHRRRRRNGWIVLVDQTEPRERELERQVLPASD